jgi:hypothetical protein
MNSHIDVPIDVKYGGYGLSPDCPVAITIRSRLESKKEEQRRVALIDAIEKADQEQKAVAIAGDIPEPDPNKYECELRKSQRGVRKYISQRRI